MNTRNYIAILLITTISAIATAQQQSNAQSSSDVKVDYDRINGTYSIVEKGTGKKVLSLGNYDQVSEISEGVMQVKLDNKYGFINIYGTRLTPLKYDYVRSFSEGYAWVRLGNMQGRSLLGFPAARRRRGGRSAGRPLGAG